MSLLTIMRDVHGVPRLAQRIGELTGEIGFVFDGENAHRFTDRLRRRPFP